MPTPIQTLNLSVRATNCLLAEDMTTVEQVADFIRKHGRNGLLRIPNLGRKWADEVMAAVGVEHDTPEQQRDILLAALEQCRFALEPYDDVKPRDWKTDRERLAAAHQIACAAIASVKGETVVGTIKCAANCGTDVSVMRKDEGEDHLCDGCVKGGAA